MLVLRQRDADGLVPEARRLAGRLARGSASADDVCLGLLLACSARVPTLIVHSMLRSARLVPCCARRRPPSSFLPDCFNSRAFLLY
eukprot:4288011-Pleurochrysis_carterae.AAC.4